MDEDKLSSNSIDMIDGQSSPVMRTVKVRIRKYSSPHSPTSCVTISDSDDGTPVHNSDVELTESHSMKCFANSKFMNPDIPVEKLIEQSVYLQQYPSWLASRGQENKNKFTPTFINRNDNIWELVFSERGYLDLLIMVHDVYMTPFPNIDPNTIIGLADSLLDKNLRTALFPGIKDLIKSHENIFRLLLSLHSERDDHVVESLGPYLEKLFDEQSRLHFSELYGRFLFAQKRIRNWLQLCKNSKQITTFLQNAQLDPRSSRKSLEDCYMVIVQRWTKVETLLEAIIRNTVSNEAEVQSLEKARNSVRSLLKSAESLMTSMEHVERLREFADHLDLCHNLSESDRLWKELRNPDTKLINHGPLYIGSQSGAIHTNSKLIEVEAVALENCFLLLKKNLETGRYSLFHSVDSIPILWWGEVYGYFRKDVNKGRFGFFIIIIIPSNIFTSFRCSTADELTRWQNIFNEGFSKWRRPIITYETLNERFTKANAEITEKGKKIESILNLLDELDSKYQHEWAARGFLYSTLINERLESLCYELSESYNSDQLSPRPDSTSNNINNHTFNNSIKISKSDLTPSRSSSTISSNSNHTNNSSINYNLSDKHIESCTSINDNDQPDLINLKNFTTNTNCLKDLDEMIFAFHEFFRHTNAITGGTLPNLSRSASDVDDHKRPSVYSIKKNQTFSTSDYLQVNDLRSSIDDGRKNKKKESHRLGTNMVNLFRTSNREKTYSTSANQTVTDTTAVTSNTQTPKPRRTRQFTPGSSTYCTISSAPPVPPKVLHLTLKDSGFNSTCLSDKSPSQTTSNACNINSTNNSLNESQEKPLSFTDTYMVLENIINISQKIFPKVHTLCTENTALRASLIRLEAERDNWKSFQKLDSEYLSNNSSANGIEFTNPRIVDSSTLKLETEKLRQDYEKFKQECSDKEKEFQQQRATIEKDYNKLNKERERLEIERKEIMKLTKQCEDARVTLQTQIDRYKKIGLKISDERLIADLKEILGDSNSNNQSFPALHNDLNSLEAIENAINRTARSDSVPKHSYSNSDDLSCRVPRAESNPNNTYGLDKNFHKSIDSDSIPKTSLGSSNSNREDKLPEHLRGSKVNQPNSNRLNESISDFRSTDQSLFSFANNIKPSIVGSSSNLQNNENSLIKLANSSKVKCSSKLKPFHHLRNH